uniref:Helitron helicase-like domain-containing protein n=1 Tax=Octopus bimaculoides TaxID=37653 RepID=A0A0L8G3U9_OCTBM
MTFVRHYGRPDLFITFTCNPKWVEVMRELLPHQQYCHRHDLIARVFKQKLTRLIDLIKKGQVFGPVKCHMYTVEWQKRGLPHAHILVWLVTKIDPTLIDDIITAEIPNPTVDQQLYDIVKAHIVHGPAVQVFKNSPHATKTMCALNNTQRVSWTRPRPLVMDIYCTDEGGLRMGDSL